MNTLWRVEIVPRDPRLDSHGHQVLQTVRESGEVRVKSVRSSRLFLLDGLAGRQAAECVAGELLADPVTERFVLVGRDEPLPPCTEGSPVEVHLKPGVMDPVAASTRLAIRDMGLSVDDVRTARRYVFMPAIDEAELRTIAARVLANDCIEEIVVGARPVAPAPKTRPYKLHIRQVAIRSLNDEELARLSREGHLFLSVDEMKVIQAYYRRIGREPTDLELETLAQTWSEHCVHKTLKSEVRYRGAPMPNAMSARGQVPSTQRHPLSQSGPTTEPSPDEAGLKGPVPVSPDETVELHYGNLLKETIAAATKKLNKPWCISVFEDNAGIIEFDDEYGVAFKVETHNHPSAIEPYGGAATGIGGVVRDIIGCGLGAKPVANTDVFCFAPPDYPIEKLPRGVMHPRRIMKGVVSGVRDYGNRMGIPTVNGAVYFDERYLGNPLVYCGTLGIIPRRLTSKAARPGDLVLVVGGRTGRDGIHGATFSSAELTDTHAQEFSHAVQIGNAITEKTVLDTVLQARDYPGGCLYTAITDCGAGGLSSAVGEMGAKIGAEVDLEKVPLKYDGLRHDEIWISEAQERMVLAVPPENLDKIMAIFAAEDVEATVIGRYTGDRKLTVRYEGTVVGELEMEFLHEGVPKMTRSAEWWPDAGRGQVPSVEPVPSAQQGSEAERSSEEAALKGPVPVSSAELKRRLGDLNVASKEWVIHQYDHEVQGGSAIKPLVGPGAGPSDAAVLRPRLGSSRGVAISSGLCPHLSDCDPYWMAVAAVDEALRNLICVGGDPGFTAILDNFCWGRPDNPRQLGALVRACQGAHDAAMAYGLPFISGKDSLNNEFAIDPSDIERLTPSLRAHLTESGRISIPGTLLISAISVIRDVVRCITTDLKRPGHPLVLVRCPAEINGLPASYAVHRAVAGEIHGGGVAAAHDASDGGILVAIAEMCIASGLGAWIDMDAIHLPAGFTVWSEATCTYVLELNKPADRFGHGTSLDAPTSDGARRATIIGRVDDNPRLQVVRGGKKIIDVPTAELAEAWRSPLAW
jgi:phosphoribosylformylglycinamidine synthase II